MSGARCAVAQMHPQASPEELLGTPSLRGLDHDMLMRAWQRAPASAHVLMIDEFEKASDATQQALLSLLAERVIYDGGRTFKMPTESLVVTSNEDIYDDAVRDRFTLTAWSVRRTPSEFRRAYRSLRPTQPTGKLTSQQVERLRATARTAVASQDDPQHSDTWAKIDHAFDFLSDIMRLDSGEEGLSPRRQLQLIDLMGAVASLHGRDYIRVSDAVVLQYAPATRAQQEAMRDYLSTTLGITRLAGYGRYYSSLEQSAEDALHEALQRAQIAVARVLGGEA